MIRIISGKYRNIIIPTLKNAKYRPATGKLREAIFSILTSGEFISSNLFTNNSNILDVFSGTGSLAFESLSRGAGSITLVDINRDYLLVAKEFATLLNESDKSSFLNINALNLSKAIKSYDLIFIDPPYYKNFIPQAIDSLIRNKWLNNQSILVVKLAKIDDFCLPDNLELIKKRIYGNSKILILKYNDSFNNIINS